MPSPNEPETNPPATPIPDQAPALSHRSLVLEDNALIAMEIEAQLIDLGAAEVDQAATATRALELIDRCDYEFAVLDVNLGHETSFRVAEVLHAAGTPHAFSTGYGEVPWASRERTDMPVLTKPFDARTLRNAVLRARQIAGERSRD